ncbi:MAG TPA: GspE/PulE family protein [Opitutaceae bacterium]|jgi:type IV pilus assembly protein PilB|nr:GspE/PulE family protein [Opitutaceae bacterium]
MPTLPPPSSTAPLGERLLAAGLITTHQLDLALREQKRTGRLIGELLHELGFVTEQGLASFLARDSQGQAVDLSQLEIQPEAAALLAPEFCRESALIPCERRDDTLRLVMADPFNVVAVDRVEQLTGLKVEVLSAPQAEILERLAVLQGGEASLDKTVDELMQIGQVRGHEATAPVIRAIEQILASAVRKSASDIHFEPDEKSFRIRLRRDGILQPFFIAPKDLQEPFTARLKVMANLDVAETRLPQDGRFTFTLGHRELNVRVSCLPSNHGESIVLRILDGGNLLLDLRALGMRPADEAMLAEAVTRPHGVILVTGPTGSGKTTTLYTALNSVNRLERAVFTLEDPIEYRLPHIRQTQVNDKIGLDFSSGLRSLLRQDPDVLLVGETRDKDTAQLMVRAALTGHLVFSSLHTNDSFSAVPRLIDLGVEPFLLPATLRLVVAQRLVRRLCPSCRQPVERPAEHLRSFQVAAPAGAEPALWKACGCPDCRGQGFRGRLAIFELLLLDDDHHPALHRGDVDQLKAVAQSKGMPSLFDDGLRRAFAGETTLEEVFRVACAV